MSLAYRTVSIAAAAALCVCAPAPLRAAPVHGGYAQRVAAQIRSHSPSKTVLGPGTASVRFRVSGQGAVTLVSASGSSPAHAALGKKIVSSIKAPPPPGGSFVANQEFNFR